MMALVARVAQQRGVLTRKTDSHQRCSSKNPDGFVENTGTAFEAMLDALLTGCGTARTAEVGTGAV